MKNKKIITASAVLGVPAIALSTVLTDYSAINTDPVTNTVPDDSLSLALGTGNTADDKSLAIGVNNEAKPIIGHHDTGGSLAVGNSNFASINSMSAGTENDAVWSSVSIGVYNDTNYYSLAAGGWNSAVDYSMALGNGNSAYSKSVSAGENNTMQQGDYRSGVVNILMGQQNTAMLKSGTANSAVSRNVLLGTENVSAVDDTWVLGAGNIGVEGSAIIGAYSDPVVDAAMIVGTGTASADRENGLIVMKNGDVIIPKAQGDIDMGGFGNNQ